MSCRSSTLSGDLCFGEKMTVNVPWSTLRPNPRDQRERNAEFPGSAGERHLSEDGEEPEIVWDVTDFGKRMAFGGIVSRDAVIPITS